MGVVNVTPDSFSDGGQFFDAERAVAHGLALAAAGAVLLDVGGESTRPGAEPVGEEEELRRVVPVVVGLAARLPATGVWISVDTTKAAVADAALAAGAAVVNDVTAGRGDAAMFGVVRRRGAGMALMHMQGEPRTMQRAPRYEDDDAVTEVGAFLAGRGAAARAAGIAAAALAFDPGIGFGKTVAHNVALLRGLPALAAAVGGDRPLVVGVSRKRFLAALVGREPAGWPAAERDAASVGVAVAASRAGARVLRVHDVRMHREALLGAAGTWAG